VSNVSLDVGTYRWIDVADGASLVGLELVLLSEGELASLSMISKLY
jgi:hypothetical protein